MTIGNTTYSNSNIGITSDDFNSDAMTITATQGTNMLNGSYSDSDWRHSGNNYTITNNSVDFVYNLSDLSSSSGSSGITQVRIGGCFPVGSKTNPVEYTVALTKKVILYANGNTSSSDTITVTLTATFGYWDSDNDCPGLNNQWTSGGFSSSSGLDFVLSVSSTERPVVTVNKVVVDESGNTITGSDVNGKSFGYSITSTNNNVETTETGSVTVGSSGVGIATTDVTNSSNYEVTETSHPDTIGDYSFVESKVIYSGSTATITNVYGVSTTSVTVTKTWDDNNYVGRPSSIDVTLFAGDEEYETATLTAADGWTYTFTDLPVKDSDKNDIEYTVKEVTVDGYTSAVDGYTITNTLDTGSLTLSKVVKADSSITTSGMNFTFYVSGFADGVTTVKDSSGNTWSVSNGVATVTVPADGSVTLVDVPVGSYTVYETEGTTDTTVTANNYTWTVSNDDQTVSVTKGGTAAAEITNTITGEAVVSITKNWDDSSNYWNTRPTNDGSTFAVTLTATGTNGERYNYTTTAAWVEGTNIWTLDLSGVTAYDTEGNMLTYTVTETEVEGYTLTNDTITVTPASDRNVSLTNKLKTATVTVTKTVLDSDGNVVSSTENDDDFRFALYDTNTRTSYGTATLTAGESKTFTVPLGTYSLTEYLVGSHDHSYDTTVTVDGTATTVTETFDSAEGVKYHTVTFTLDDEDTDKNIAVAVTNQEEEITITEDNLNLFLQGIKYLVNADTETVGEMNFTYSIYNDGNALVATGTVTTAETAGATTSTNNITWWTISDPDAFTYTEVGTYTYTIIENVTANSGIVYDTARYNLVVTVSKDENGGGLIAEATLVKYENNAATSDVYDTILVATTDESYVPTETLTVDWTNTYDPSDASIILRAYKNLEGRTLTAGEFSAIVTEYDDETYSGRGTVIGTQTNGTNGYMSLEIIYDEDDAGIDGTGTFVAESTGSQGVSSYGTLSKTHYYTVTEAIPDGATDNGDGTYTYNSVTYDVTIYYVKVTVSMEARQTASGNYLTYERTGAVTVSSAEYSTDGDTWTDLFAYNDETKEYDEVNLTFTNTYTAKGSGTLSTYKVMQGRDFNAGETFTFTITALDSAAPTLTDPHNGVEFTDNNDGTYTVTVTVPGDVADDTTILNEILANISVDQDDVGSWVYTVYETSASETNGMELDTATYGHLITVTVADDGDGTMTVTTESTNDTDWNGDGDTDTASSVIVNTFRPGIKTIYGTKVWVDGGASHDNESEVTLTLFYSINGTSWKQYTDDYTVTWGTANTSDWHIAGLPIYDADGNTMYYQVVETYNNGNSYTTTYSTADGKAGTIPEDNSSTNRYTITNTIEQEYMTISGTKTWVEPADENGEAPHNNAEELVLTVTRNSDGTTLSTLTQATGNGDSTDDSTYIVVWSGDTYNIYWYYDEETQDYVGLPVYDASGYIYSYRVEESYAAAYEETYTDYEEDDAVFTKISDTEVTFDFTNRAPNDDEEKPVKTETTITDAVTKEEGKATTTDTNFSSGSTVTYDDVAVGDTITYSISYYNNANTSATITITDELDRGLTFVSASPNSYAVTGETTVTEGSSTWNYGGTITWTLTVDAFASGSVTVTAKVNSNARSISSGETAATVENEATVYNAETEHTATTNIVTNPLEDDKDETTEKGIISVTYEDEEGDEYTRDDTDGKTGNIIVQEGDQIHYIISRYNNTNESVTFVIVDTLDEGVTYAYSSLGSTYYADATTVTVNGVNYDIPAHSVVWIVSTNPFSTATVQMTVTVDSSAKTATQTYDAGVPGTYSTSKTVADYTGYTYGTGDDTTASVANQAVAYTVGNDVVSYSNVIENPLDDDDPVAPTKTEPYREVVKDTTDTDNTVTYGSVDFGDMVEYKINYYNNHNTQATITIVDKLDADVELVLRSLGDTYDDSDGVYTWTLTNGTVAYDTSSRTITWRLTVEPLTSGYVEFMVTVQKTAVKDETLYPDDEGTIVNSATVTNSEDDDPTNEYTTNIVVNPVDDDPAEPKKEVASSSDGADGDNVAVGDEITYEITYYNHNSESATIKIEDTLDPNVELVGATDKEGNSLYDGITGILSQVLDYVSGKVTWTFTADAYETGTVTITVKVKDGAQGETVNNSATVSVNNESKTTTETENPVDDDPVDPVKTEDGTAVSGLDASGNVSDTDNDGDINDETVTYEEVAVDDTITYTISYYNHYGEAADVTITDSLDSGVTYVSSSDNGVYTNNTRTVTWTIPNVAAYEKGTVTLTVKVNSTAKTITPGEPEATVDNQATVTITEDDNTTSNTTNVVVNPLADDVPTNPTKTEVEVLDDSTGKTNTAHAADSVTEEDGTTSVTYGDVGVGDVITYQIGYTNHMNGIATITIEDVLDEGVDFVSATGESDANTIATNKDTTSNYVTYATTTDSEDRVTTVTWTIYNVDPYGTGTVTLKVKVNEKAKTTEATETEATVKNSATETNSLDIDNGQTTNVVVNPLEDDEPEAPTKTLETVNDATAANAADEDKDTYGNLYVSVGDTVTYSITYYNNLNEVADVVIEDVLDEGVTFGSLTDENGNTLDGFYYEDTHSVKYTAEKVAPLTGGTVYLTVTVNDKAKTSTNTYTVNQNADSDYSLTYGVGSDTTASIANQASTTVVSTTIGHQTTYYSNVVENPLEEDEEQTPTKTETEIDNVETTEPKVEGNTYTYDTVGVGKVIEYEISYYNYHNTTATITITDVLDEGVDYVEKTASNDGVYDETTHTITWNLTVEPLTEGTVSFQVMVNETAKTIDEDENTATVKNEATVVTDEDPETENKTNIVVNPIDPDEPENPVKTVSTSSQAGVNGANVNVGDQITYVLTYYNHTNSVADVTIEDVLDEGFTYVSANYGGEVTGEITDTESGLTYGGTVNWTIKDVDPYTGGSVELTVEVNENALTDNKVKNEADVTIGDNKYTTDTTTNLVNDEPEDPTKTLTSVTDGNKVEQTAKDTEGNTYVSVGDTVTYAITYYNNLNAVADVIIEDELDPGVTFVSLTDESGKVLDAAYNAHTITYTVKDVPALTEGTVYLTVTVNEYAKYSTNTYVVSKGNSLTYGVDPDTTASIANQASVTVGNQAISYTNVVEDPLEEDEPEDPTKTETTVNGEAAGEGTDAKVNGKDVVEYDEVAVNDSIVYTIEYYNYHNTAATITITDELDDGVTYAHGSATNGGVYNEDTHTITWKLTVEPLTGGTVSFRVIVNETAKTIETGETTATVDNDATVVFDEEDPEVKNTYTTNIVTNPIEPDDPEDPTKVVSEDSEAGVDNANVNLGDQITYTIDYYNHTNSVATVTIEDELDDGVDFVEATGTDMTDGTATAEGNVTYVVDSSSGKTVVTWTITNVAPYTGGSVDLTVEVNENASTETNEYTVENDADVTIGDPENKYDTNVVTNLVNDEPESPTKTLKEVTYAEEGTAAASDDNDNLYVHVGDTITYSIKYYNNLNETATVKVVDVLDEGVTFYDASSGYFFSGGSSVNYGGTVSWTIQNVPALSYGEVTVTVIVNDKAVASTNTYTLNQNTETTTTTDPITGEETTTTTTTSDYTLTYGTTTYVDEVTGEKTSETDTTASIANQASTTVSSATVTNQATYYSVPVENPLEEEDPVDPVKTAETVEEEDVEPTVTEAPDGTEIHEYDTVSVGETVTYTISYYNHHNTEATITIEDPLDEGLTVYEDTITDGGVYDADKHTITWTLIVEPLSGGTVSFQAMVNENAKTINTAEETVATVENGATETNSEDVEIGREYKTNIVVHPIDPDDPSNRRSSSAPPARRVSAAIASAWATRSPMSSPTTTTPTPQPT